MVAPFILLKSQEIQKQKEQEKLWEIQNNNREFFIKEKKLQKIPFQDLNQELYPLYLDGTTYYKDPNGII